MARASTTFNFGANAKPKKTTAKKTKGGAKSDAWRAYTTAGKRKR